MKLKVGVLILILVTIATFSLFGTVGAANTGTVSPSVTVGTTLSLIMENPENVQWGSKSAGTTQTGIIQAKVGANANWTLTVSSSTTYGLAGQDGNHNIPASSFTYTSAAGSPAPPAGSGVGATQFSDSSTNVWTGGTATSDCRVAVNYSLQIPASQYPQAYSATHTYTLAAS